MQEVRVVCQRWICRSAPCKKHQSVHGSRVDVVEKVERLHEQLQFLMFGEGKALAHLKIHVDELGHLGVVARNPERTICRGSRAIDTGGK
jgi:hypothetical protein